MPATVPASRGSIALEAVVGVMAPCRGHWLRPLADGLASHLESSTPIEVTRHGRTIGLYVPLPQQGNLSDRDKVLEAGRLMQAELERLGLSEDELSADFRAWRKGRHEQATA